MRAFLSHVVSDLHRGRESWRVITVVTLPAFAITIVARLFLR